VELLAGAMVLLVITTGTATLSGHPVVMIVLGALLAGAVLLLTRGREIRARRRADRRPATALVAADRQDPTGPVTDVVPEDALTAVPLDGRTAAAVTLGVAGLFLFNIMLGPLAVGLGLGALRRGTPGRWGRPAARAAVLLGIADLVVLAVLLAMRSSGDAFQWQI
jgi:hypothetical protein